MCCPRFYGQDQWVGGAALLNVDTFEKAFPFLNEYSTSLFQLKIGVFFHLRLGMGSLRAQCARPEDRGDPTIKGLS